MRVHLDTDFAGDPDDACALAMLLGWSGVELTGITTTLEHLGRRAGCVRYVLDVVGRLDVPVAAGAETTLTGRRFEPTWGDLRHWPKPVEPLTGTVEAALNLLSVSIASGATVIAIGGFTNLAMLELSRPGTLDGVPVVAMSGWFGPAAEGLPQWGPDMDSNPQVDTRAAEIVAATASLTLVPLTIAIGTWLRRGQLGRLRAAGELGRLLADQSEAHALDAGFAELAHTHQGLPDDLVNFHWDPVTCAVALGWSGAQLEDRRMSTRITDGVLTFVDDPDGRNHRCVTSLDGEAFSELWLAAIEQIAPITRR